MLASLALVLAAQDPAVRFVDLTESGHALRFLPTAATSFAAEHREDPEGDPPAFEVHAAPGTSLTLDWPASFVDWQARAWDGPGAWRPLALDRRDGVARVTLQVTRPREVVELRPPSSGAVRATGYSFQDLSDYLHALSPDPRLTVSVLGNSVQGREIVKVEFDDRASLMPATWKPTIVVLVRQHGNEWACSYVFEGMLDYLLGRNGWNPPPEITERTRFVFYPMINPDGVELDQRYNANGIDLNRDWSGTGPQAWQQPEVFLVQSDLGNLPYPDTVRVGGDQHGWWSGHDGGFRYDDGSPPAGVSHATYLESIKDTARYTQYEPMVWDWRENGGQNGMSRVELHAWKGWVLHTPEYDSPSSRPEAPLRTAGARYVQALRDTVSAVAIDTATLSLGESVPLRVDEDDENLSAGTVETVEVVVGDWRSGDRERVVLTETGPDTGLFTLTPGLPTAGGAAVPQDGVLQTSVGSWIVASYGDVDQPTDQSYDGRKVLP